ncbi:MULTISPECIES: NAD(P)-dependent oxidoreductase [Aquincola]|uniref:NAD(P)-dependent oxidoreductase n=1 Tax=Aquincola TaxID=391952 RepID=UPI000614E490|nr:MULTISPECIES: NAD(P)-dependent oxidoreductase [Aquincola]MCR5865282.1 NAD(P)-dependent oxidoreductase [Aquincola sp. J276]
MKIALIGGTGFVGKAVLDELLRRGHAVTALARDTGKYAGRDGVTAVKADALDAQQVAAAVAGHDAVIDAYNPGWGLPDIHDLFLKGTEAILDGVQAAGLKRVLVVGGAGSLFIAPGLQLIDTPEFPAEWKQGALAAREALNRIRGRNALDWTFLSPPVHLAPGERTGAYRVGGDEVPMVAGEPAGISVADLAVAIVDEIETPKHVQKRFTVYS